MLPPQLTAESFAAYAPEAKKVATANLDLLRRLPLGFAPLVLRELILYDEKFPMERFDLDRQFKYLGGLPPDRFDATIAAFANLRISRDLEKTDWVNSPGVFSEQLTAELWKTHQIDAFRAAAIDYVDKANAAFPDEPLPTHRLGVAIIGQGVRTNDYRLFRKLRPHGTYYSNVRAENGLQRLTDALARRSAAHSGPYRHWHIDGGAAPVLPGSVALVSYAALAPARAGLQGFMQKTYEAAVFDPEAFRTTMAQIKPAEIGLDAGSDAAMRRFQLSVLTEGSGTQVFATTFVQWATREALRRAQPLTLVARYAPRQREKQMNELLAEASRRPELDPAGSLVDADMAAYYHWLNQQRLPGADQSRFLAWFEDHREAVVVAPGFERGKTVESEAALEALVSRLT